MTSVSEYIGFVDQVYNRLHKKGAEKRAAQVAMSHLVMKTILAPGHVCTEGQTGTGKSQALLIPAFIWSMSEKTAVAISTGTKFLQKQVIESDFERVKDHIEEIMGRAPVIAVLKGKSNYISRTRYHNYVRYALDKEVDDPDIMAVTNWLEKETETGDLADVPLPDFIPPSRICVRDNSSDDAECFYLRALTRAKGADVIITNHHSVLSRFRQYTAGKERIPLFEELNVHTILFDEAHLLEGIALDLFTKSVSLFEIKNCISSLLSFAENNGIGTGMKKGDIKYLDILRESEESVRKQMRDLQKHQGDGPLTFMDRAGGKDAKTADAIRSCFDTFKRAMAPAAEYGTKLTQASAKKSIPAAVVKESIEQLDAYVQEMSDITNAYNASGNLLFLKFSDVRGYPSIIQANNRLKGILSAKWMLFDSLVFTSATLSVPSQKSADTWAYFTEGIGLQQGQYFKPRRIPEGYKVFPSPFDFANVHYYAPAPGVPAPKYNMDRNDRNGYERYIVKMISHACEHDHDGGIMVLCTSFYDIDAFAGRLKRHPEMLHGREILQHKRGMSSNDIRKAFLALGNKGLMLATGSFWTGADFPGKELTGIIIPKLPFDTQDDPTLMIRKMNMANPEKTFFPFVILPAAVIRFRQGIGRLIRSQSDYGSIYVGDSRIHKNTQFELALAHIKNNHIFEE